MKTYNLAKIPFGRKNPFAQKFFLAEKVGPKTE